MSEETIALTMGSLFLLIAIVGGGFSVERAQIPQVPTWARVVSSVIGASFLAFFAYATLGGSGVTPVVDRATDSVVERQAPTEARPPADGIHRDAGPHATASGIELTDLVASWQDPLVVNDTLAIGYRLTNAGDTSVELEYVFVGVRDPADTNRDKEVDQLVTLAPGDSIDLQTTLLLDQEGVWSIWPCFGIAGGTECPDEWRAFEVAVTAG
ncbi:hypothetical protein [Nocardioides sediminis]|uniref:hypothetical protein n=1 Tax=Nocardioides sediminis TaxID=433648 RepID=UPI000D3215BC|nr:hypothetical protein [Nocardioides sediminis]